MANLKRLCDLAVGIVCNLLLDLSHAHPSLKKEFTRDSETVRNRVTAEGVPFITLTMPKLGAAIIAALQNGHLVTPSCFATRKGSALPRFMGGLLAKVFDEDGVLIPDHDPLVVAELLQVTEIAKKLSLPYSKRSQQRVIDAFLATEDDLERLVIPDDMVIKRARATITAIFKDFDPMEITPRHGPGSVASGEKGVKKWVFSTHYAQIHSCYPYYEYFTGTRRSLLTKKEISAYRKRKVLMSGCAKVCLVDKDSRGPRLISLEPLEYQFIQQGLGRAIMAHLENHPITRGRVNFTDQEPNRQMALTGSLTGSIATLDMKEASDRVSTQLVEMLFGDCPALLKCLMATRTPRTRLPNGDIVNMRKFAPMGSALCFPIESVIFFALCRAIIETNGGTSDQLRVYGDDLIIPQDVALPTMARLPVYGLRVNVDKSFTHGPFRESCGMDALSGIQITPQRWRKPWPRSSSDAGSVVAFVDLVNRLYCAGYWSTVSYLEKRLSKSFPKYVAYVGLNHQTGSLGFVRCTAEQQRVNLATKANVRWNSELHRYEIKRFALHVKTVDRIYGPHARLFAHLIQQFTESEPVRHTAPQALRARWFCARELVENMSAA